MQLKITMTLVGSLFLIMVSGCAGGMKGLGVEQETVPEESASASTQPPDWVLGKGHPRFPQGRYLIGIGISDENSVSANESARSNLAKNLKVKIHSTMVDVSTTEQTYVESVIETEVDTVLEGVEIKDGWLDPNKGVYYSLAIVERSLAASTIQDRIRKIESVLKRNLNEGTEAENEADVINALSHYLSGYQKAPTLTPLKSALYVITRSPENSGSQNISASEFKSRIKGIVHNLNLATISGDRQVVKTQKGVAEPLVAKVYLLKAGSQVPVSNIPVVFNYEAGRGELEQEKTSGPDGTVQTTIHKISSYEESNHVIAVKLDYSRVRSNFNGDFVEKFLSPLKNKRATFNYAIQTPKWASNKSQAWRESITDLSNQLIRNIPPGKNPLLGVMPFKDLRYNRVTPFSRILNEDIKTILVRAEDLILKEIKINGDQEPGEIANANGLDYYVSGSYRMERTGLEVRSRLIDTQTRNIHSSANILIERKRLNPEDLALIDNMADEFKSAQKIKNFQEHLEKLIAAKPDNPSFNADVWTDKKEYEVNEKIVFFVKADKNGFLTMLDVGPNGNITVIFPNKYHKDNFIRAGVTYQVPSPNYGFEFDIQGPAGLERIKAIVTLNNGSLLKLDLENGFHSMERGTTRGKRDILILSKQIDAVGSSSWAEAYSEIFIFRKGEKYIRGSRKIPILEVPKKPIDMIGTFGNEPNRD
jgi:TolB-like protein